MFSLSRSHPGSVAPDILFRYWSWIILHVGRSSGTVHVAMVGQHLPRYSATSPCTLSVQWLHNSNSLCWSQKSSSFPSWCPSHLSHHVPTPKYLFLLHTEIVLNPNRLRGKDSVLVPQDLSLEQLVVTPECFSFSFFISFVLLCTMISASRHILLRGYSVSCYFEWVRRTRGSTYGHIHRK